MSRMPPREPPPERRPDSRPPGRFRRDVPRPEGPFDRLLKRRPERDPAPIIIGGTIAFLAVVIIMVLAFSSVFGGGGGGDSTSDGDGTIDIAPGIRGRRAQIPALPPGLASLSDYVEFDSEEDTPVTIGLPLSSDPGQDAGGLGFYTYFDGRWQRLSDVSVKQIESRVVGEGDFTTVPQNLAVLRVLTQTYQVAASLPTGASLHPDARVNIINPRDYSPASDGSVQGSKTEVAAEGALIMPTIVGSSQDTAAVVNDILSDGSLRDHHIQVITDLVKNAPYDGIDLEYSSVDVDLAGEFSDFVKGLSDSLHSGNKRLSLTLPPPTNKRQAYEWKELGNSVDIIRILPIADPVAYWETMPGAVSQVVKDVDPGKVMLVVSPFSIEGTGDVTRPMGYLQAMVQAAEAVVREPNASDIESGVTVKLIARNLDEGEGASTLRWSDDAAALTYAIGGTERKRIFVENRFSVSFKLELVQAYGLGGLAVSDASGQSDVANVWPTVNEFVRSNTATLIRPNDTMLLPLWQSPEGGDLGAGAGTTATWIAPAKGTYNIILIVSDGERRFGRKLPIEVKEGNEPSPTPAPATFPPDESPTPTPEGSATPTPAGVVTIEVFVKADGDDEGSGVSNDEVTSAGSEVTYQVIVDNDSDVSVTITEITDDIDGVVDCGGLVGTVLEANDGDGPGGGDGGADEVTCTYTVIAPDPFTLSVEHTATVTAEDDDGNPDDDFDGAVIRPE